MSATLAFASRNARDLFAPIARDLEETERILKSTLQRNEPGVSRLVNHLAHYRGKRLRPALLMLTAQACGGVRPAHHLLAAVVEMIHTATLVHDDVLDSASTRRHVSTVNAGWGNQASILLGDYLFTHAFHLAASLESTLACRWIGRATNLVCEGEMMQVHNRGNFELSEADYFEIIRGKTAELTAVSCRLGAHYAGAPAETVAALEGYGRDLGVAFQIADDVLDIWGEEYQTGKSLGTDLEKQKLTLPLIRLLATAPLSTTSAVRRLLADGDGDNRHALRPYLESSGALDYAWAQAERFASQASDALDVLPDSPARATLRDLAAYVVRRAS